MAECCPDCGHPARLVRKGRPLARCGPCQSESLRRRHRDWEQQHQDERRAYQQARKARTVPYQAWRTCVLDDGRVLVCRARGHWVSRVYVVQGAACSCGQGRCVHMVVAGLVQQGGGDDG